MLISAPSNHSYRLDIALRASASAQVQPASSVRSEEKQNNGELVRKADAPANRGVAEAQLSEAEKKQVRELSERDREVRAHEQAHAAAAGGLAKGGPSFTYKRGPDGKQYAVGGEVQIDTSSVADDPQASIQKAQRIRSAALAPAQPSAQDRSVAAQAAKMEAEARSELATEARTDAKSGADGAEGKGQGTSPVEQASGQNKETSEVSSECALCGGQHSVESHSAANQQKLSSTFIAEHDDPLGKLLSVSA